MPPFKVIYVQQNIGQIPLCTAFLGSCIAIIQSTGIWKSEKQHTFRHNQRGEDAEISRNCTQVPVSVFITLLQDFDYCRGKICRIPWTQ